MLAGILLLCLPACSTLNMAGGGERYLLGGTRENVHAFTPAHKVDVLGKTVPFIAFLDFPCSLALDLVLVPVMLPLQLVHGDHPHSDAPMVPPEGELKRP